MSGAEPSFQVAAWDSQFFGIAIAQVSSAAVTKGRFDQVVDDLRAVGVRLAYIGVPADGQVARDILAKAGAALVDIKVRYRRDLTGSGDTLHTGSPVQRWTDPRADAALRSLAVQSGAYSRFNVDSKIPIERFRALYETWIDKSVSGELADSVWVVSSSERVPQALVTVRAQGTVGEIGLLAVDTNVRRQGLGRELISAALAAHRAAGCSRAEVVTQEANAAACRLYEASGYRVDSRVAMHHLWLDNAA